MSFTVTATASGAGSVNGTALQVVVLTNAVESGGASAVFSNMGTSETVDVSLTPNANGSVVPYAIQVYPSDTIASNNAYYSTPVSDPDGSFYAAGKYTGTVTAGTPITCGTSVSGQYSAIAAYEIKGASGSPSQDASTPVFASTTSAKNVTSAAFTPPAGAVLVALVTSNGNTSGSITEAITDSSGLGLTWTQRAIASAGSIGSQAAVFTATVPSSSTKPAGLLTAMGV